MGPGGDDLTQNNNKWSPGLPNTVFSVQNQTDLIYTVEPTCKIRVTHKKHLHHVPPTKCLEINIK